MNVTNYCQCKTPKFINIINISLFDIFKYLNISDIINLLKSLYYIDEEEINGIIINFLDIRIQNLEDLNKYFNYHSDNSFLFNELYYEEMVDIISEKCIRDLFDFISEKRTLFVIEFITKNRKYLKKYSLNNFDEYYLNFINDLSKIDNIEETYNILYKKIFNIGYRDDDEYNDREILYDNYDSEIRIQSYRELNNKIIKKFKKFEERFPNNKIYTLIQIYNSIFLNIKLKKLKELLIGLKNSSSIQEFKYFYDESKNIIKKIPNIKNKSELDIFNECYTINPSLKYLVEQIYVIVDDNNIRIDKEPINEEIQKCKDIRDKYKYIRQILYLKENYENDDNIKINHSLELKTFQYDCNEFDFEINIESISLQAIVDTINLETGKEFILTEEIKENIGDKFNSQCGNIFYHMYESFNNSFIYINDYIIYHYLKNELIKIFLSEE